MIYLFKTHYSSGRGIIQVNDADDTSGVLNLVDICLRNNIQKCFVVDDNLSGIWPIYKTLAARNIDLVFGLNLWFVNDLADNNLSLHKNIIFARNETDYKQLIKLATTANLSEDFAKIDYNTFHNEFGNLTVAVPFYKSFIYQNSLTENQCVPDFRGIKPTMFIEDNKLPFDLPLKVAVESYANSNGNEILETKTVLYEKSSQCFAYQARRCMNRTKGKQRTLQKPELSHFGSDQFCIIK